MKLFNKSTKKYVYVASVGNKYYVGLTGKTGGKITFQGKDKETAYKVLKRFLDITGFEYNKTDLYNLTSIKSVDKKERWKY